MSNQGTEYCNAAITVRRGKTKKTAICDWSNGHDADGLTAFAFHVANNPFAPSTRVSWKDGDASIEHKSSGVSRRIQREALPFGRTKP